MLMPVKQLNELPSFCLCDGFIGPEMPVVAIAFKRGQLSPEVHAGYEGGLRHNGYGITGAALPHRQLKQSAQLCDAPGVRIPDSDDPSVVHSLADPPFFASNKIRLQVILHLNAVMQRPRHEAALAHDALNAMEHGFVIFR